MSEQAYLDMLDQLHTTGMVQDNRTGIDAIRKVFHSQEYNTYRGTTYNLFTHKKLPPVSIVGELIAFAQGKTNAADFRALGCNVWNKNANEHGERPNAWLSNPTRKGEDDLGPIYGKQWRTWEDTKFVEVAKMNESNELLAFYEKLGYQSLGTIVEDGVEKYAMHRKVDQLKRAIGDIINSPTSRRIIISAWNVGDLEFMALPPCHVLQHYLCTQLTEKERFDATKARVYKEVMWDRHHGTHAVQVDTNEWEPSAAEEAWEEINRYQHLSHDSLDQWAAPRYRLDLVMWQRSADSVLGTPYNVASYDAMLNVMAQLTNTAPGSLFYLTSDTHIYKDHSEACIEIKEERGVHPENMAMFLVNPKIKTLQDLDNAVATDFVVINYHSYDKLRSETKMAV